MSLYLIGCSEQNNKTSTWNNDLIKITVLSQCVMFTKIGTTNPKNMTSDDVNYLTESMQNGIDFKNLDSTIHRKSKCCAEIIFANYSQEFYYSQNNSSVFITDAISQCK